MSFSPLPLTRPQVPGHALEYFMEPSSANETLEAIMQGETNEMNIYAWLHMTDIGCSQVSLGWPGQHAR